MKKLIAITVGIITITTLPSVGAAAAWVQNEGKWNYLSDLGEVKTGWVNDNGIWYFSDASGKMQTGVVQVDGKMYSLDTSTGAMQVGNVTISGKVYVFTENGEAIGKDMPVSIKAFNSNGIEIMGTNNSKQNKVNGIVDLQMWHKIHQPTH